MAQMAQMMLAMGQGGPMVPQFGPGAFPSFAMPAAMAAAAAPVAEAVAAVPNDQAAQMARMMLAMGQGGLIVPLPGPGAPPSSAMPEAIAAAADPVVAAVAAVPSDQAAQMAQLVAAMGHGGQTVPPVAGLGPAAVVSVGEGAKAGFSGAVADVVVAVPSAELQNFRCPRSRRSVCHSLRESVSERVGGVCEPNT